VPSVLVDAVQLVFGQTVQFIQADTAFPDGFFLRFRTSPRSMTKSWSYLMPSIRREEKGVKAVPIRGKRMWRRHRP